MSTIISSFSVSSDSSMFLNNSWVSDCTSLKENKRIAVSPVTGEKKKFDHGYDRFFDSYQSSSDNGNIGEIYISWANEKEVIEQNSDWHNYIGDVIRVKITFSGYRHRTWFCPRFIYKFVKSSWDISSIHIEDEINNNWADILDAEYRADEWCNDVKIIASPWFEWGDVTEDYMKNNLQYWSDYEYISDSNFQYYFGDAERNSIPNWAVISRLLEITPNVISKKAEISKKLARKVYNQFSFNWFEHGFYNLKEGFEISNEEDREIFLFLCNSIDNGKVINIFHKLFMEQREKFNHREVIKENGQEFPLSSYLDRILYYKSGMNISEELFFEGMGVKRFCEAIEDSQIMDKKVDVSFIKKTSWIKTVTANPREIVALGRKYNNCLRYRGESWAKDHYIGESVDGAIFEFSKGMNLLESHIVNNYPCSFEQENSIKEFLNINKETFNPEVQI